MTNRPLEKMLRAAGRLCVNPTDLSTAYPHGGADLGNIRAVACRPVVRYYRVRAEEFGGRMVEAAALCRGEILSVIFRGASNKALEILYPRSEAGTTTGDRLVYSAVIDDDDERDGLRLSGKAVTLCFSPDDRAHPTVLFQKALPMLEESAELALQTNRDYEHAAVFEAIPLVSGARPWQAGRWQDITIGAQP